MAVLLDPFEALASFQQALDAYRTSSWLDPGLSGSGAYPPLNVFRKGDDFIVIAELPGIKKSDLDVQVKGRTIRLSGEKAVGYPEKAALHRRERLAGRFDRAVTNRNQSRRRQGRISRRHSRCVSSARRERQAEVDQGGLR
jgi:HSP20 family protein